MYFIKRSVILLVSIVTMFTSFGPGITKVVAAENDIGLSDEIDNDSPVIVEKDEKLYIENFEISYEEKGAVIEIEVVDLETGEVAIAEVDSEEKTLMIDDEYELLNIEDNIYSLNDMSINSISTYGPFRTNFNVNPKSAAVVVGAIAGITAIATAVSSAGLSLAAFKSGLTTAWSVISTASGLDWLAGGVSVSGYFQYSQQVDTSANRARNINRRVYISVSQGGSRKASRSYSHGSGGWFHYTRPYSNIIVI